MKVVEGVALEPLPVAQGQPELSSDWLEEVACLVGVLILDPDHGQSFVENPVLVVELRDGPDRGDACRVEPAEVAGELPEVAVMGALDPLPCRRVVLLDVAVDEEDLVGALPLQTNHREVDDWSQGRIEEDAREREGGVGQLELLWGKDRLRPGEDARLLDSVAGRVGCLEDHGHRDHQLKATRGSLWTVPRLSVFVVSGWNIFQKTP